MAVPAPFPKPVQTLKSDCPVSPEVWEELAASADAEEAGTSPIRKSIDVLSAAGLLMDDGAHDPQRTARTLMKVGAANLSVGRLWEGHVNALRLINLYGTFQQKGTVRDQIANGALLGVWGADGAEPVTWAPPDEHINGSKNFASGLGTVSYVVVTVNSGPAVRLALIDVSNVDRADASKWKMHGMKATASGTFDFTNLPTGAFDWIGAPGDYLKEPNFVGDVWRIAALQVGATVGLIDRAAARLRDMERMQAEQQKVRLGTVLMRAWAGMALVERAALATANRDLPAEQIVSMSISSRLFTEEVGLAAITAVEQSLGLQHFAQGSQTGRMARDLSVYLRQAARDAFVQRAAEFALGQEGKSWGVFE